MHTTTGVHDIPPRQKLPFVLFNATGWSSQLRRLSGWELEIPLETPYCPPNNNPYSLICSSRQWRSRPQSMLLSILACKCTHLLSRISLHISPSSTGLRGKCGDDEPKGIRNVRSIVNTPSMQITLRGVGYLSSCEYGNERFLGSYLRLMSTDGVCRGTEGRGSQISCCSTAYALRKGA
jgi:hypothetical protein